MKYNWKMIHATSIWISYVFDETPQSEYYIVVPWVSSNIGTVFQPDTVSTFLVYNNCIHSKPKSLWMLLLSNVQISFSVLKTTTTKYLRIGKSWKLTDCVLWQEL